MSFSTYTRLIYRTIGESFVNFITFASESYKSRADLLVESIHHYHPDGRIDRHDVTFNGQGYVPNLARRRLQVALMHLESGWDHVVIIGADCVLYSRMTELASCLKTNDAIIVPHAVHPVDDRNYMAQIYRTGHANADLMAFKNTENGKNMLRWLISVTEGNEPERGIFYEQTWLSSLPFLFEGVRILRHPGYNVGYWDIRERMVSFNDLWRVLDEHGTFRMIRMVQFSGYEKGNAHRMSKYYNGPDVTGDVLKLFQEYDSKI